MITEVEYWRSVFSSCLKPKVPILPYVPKNRVPPSRMVEVPSAWKGIESILSDLISRFEVAPNRCLEFGVERGYSTAALSSFFDSVTGIDTFKGDKHTNHLEDLYEATSNRLSGFDNIRLIRDNYQGWIIQDDSYYDLIHVDIIHTYADTYACGLWSAMHSHCVLFHDTESFPAVKQAVVDISRESGKKFYNFTESFGLGILV